MKKLRWQLLLGAGLLAMSLFCYFTHYLIFRDLHHIFIYLLGDIGFVFIEVLIVTLIIHRVLERREKKARLEKLNMVIGVFFSEVGRKLLEKITLDDGSIDDLQVNMFSQHDCPIKKFTNSLRYLETYSFSTQSMNPNWISLKDFLVSKRLFLLSLLENSNLLEHESFTEMLWAVFHMVEELEARDKFNNLPKADISHLKNDLKRVYGNLAMQWFRYMDYLKVNYPYLFSLAVRKNPFDRNSAIIIER